MQRVVVFCFDNVNALGLVRCLGEAGYKPECYCYGEETEYILSSRYISKGIGFKTKEDCFSFLLDEYPIYEEKPVLLTIPDYPAYMVDSHLDHLKKKFIVMNAGETGGVIHWMNKKNIGDLAQKHNLTIPWTIELSKNDDIPENIEYPVFTKSIRTADGGKCDESICRNREELKSRMKTLTSNKFLVMKYIQKKKEVNFFGIAIKGHVYINYCDERTRLPKDGYGHYNTYKKITNDNLYKNMVSMIQETGYEGLFDVEFLEGNDSVLYFMEVNFRVDGTVYRLTPGINLPAEWCRLVNLPDSELPDSLNGKKECFSGMNEYSDFKASVLGGLVNPFVWFVQFIMADKRMLVNLMDPKPMFVKTFYRVIRKLHHD